jgi:Tfp pilus assembly protein PilO
VNRRRAPLFVGIAAGVVALIAVVALLLPKISAVHKRQDELAAAQQQEQTLRAQLGQLEQAREQARQIKGQLQQLQSKIPSTADLPSLIRLLQAAATTSAVDFVSISPGQPAAPEGGTGVSTIPVAIQVGGSFFSVEEFLFRLEHLPRAVKVTQISVAAGGGGAATGTTVTQELTLSITGQVYTTDTSAGPGSVPGPTAGAAPVVPAPTTSPGATPTPSATPTTGA